MTVFSTDGAMGQCRVVSRLRHVRAPGADGCRGAVRSALVGKLQCQTQTDAGLLMTYQGIKHQGSKGSKTSNFELLCFVIVVFFPLVWLTSSLFYYSHPYPILKRGFEPNPITPNIFSAAFFHRVTFGSCQPFSLTIV